MHRVYVDVDLGWAWTILGAAFLGQAIISLYTLSGVFNIIFLDVFKRSATVTALMVGLHSALVSLIGPISSILINRYGPRLTYAIGGTLSFMGFFVTFFSHSFEVVFFFYSIVAGTGLGIAYTCATTVPSLYFVKHLNLAVGLSVTGVAVGSIAFAPLVRICEDTFGWRGTMLIMAACTAHLFVCSVVTWPLRPRNLDSLVILDVQSGYLGKDMTVKSVEEMNGNKEDLEKLFVVRDTKANGIERDLKYDQALSGTISKGSQNGNVVIQSKDELGDCEFEEVITLLENNAHESVAMDESVHGKGDTGCNQNEKVCFCSSSIDVNSFHAGMPNSHGTKDGVGNCDNYIQKLLEEQSVNHINTLETKFLEDKRGNDVIYCIKCTEKVNIGSGEETCSCSVHYSQSDVLSQKVKPQKKQTFDVDIFHSVEFWAFCIAQVFQNSALGMFYAFLPVLAVSHGASHMAASNLIAWSSVAGIFSRVFLGVLANYSGVHEYTLNVAITAASAASLLATPALSHWMWGRLASALLFGTSGVLVYVTAPATCISILGGGGGDAADRDAGARRVGSAIGTVSFMYGLGYLLGPPLGGFLYDTTQDHNYTFYLAGFCSLVACLIFTGMYVRLKVTRAMCRSRR